MARREKWVDAWTEFANRHGGEVVKGAPRIDVSSIRLGTTARISVGTDTFELDALTGKDRVGTRFSGPCRAPATFKVFVIPQNALIRLIASPAVSGFLRKQMPKGARVEIKGSEDNVAFQEAEMLMFGDPVPIGDPEFDRWFLVRTSDAAQARELFDDGSFRRAFIDLHEKGKTFSWAIAPSPKSGEMRIEYDEWEIMLDVDRLEEVHALMTRALDRVDQLPKAATA